MDDDDDAPVDEWRCRRETDVMDTEWERQRIRHRAGIVDGPAAAVDSAAGG